MSTLAEFAGSITIRDVFILNSGGEEISLSELSSLDAAVRASGETAVHWAIRETLLRLAETHILSHPRIAHLIDVWDGLVGSARERIASHLSEILGGDPAPDLVDHIFHCLSGTAAQRGRKSGAHSYALTDLFERIAAEKGQRSPLRCECCGYHFRVKDLAQDKVRDALDYGLEFDRSLFPGRAADPLKPIQRGANQSMTALTIDHVIPEETLGWSDPDNLAVLCMFCNLGKLSFRRPLEAISSFAVGALAEVPRDRGWSSLKHQIIVAALRSQAGRCSSCGASRHDNELTVRPAPRSNVSVMRGFAPWNLRTLCYRCVAADADNGLPDDERVAGD